MTRSDDMRLILMRLVRSKVVRRLANAALAVLLDEILQRARSSRNKQK